jgi:hypothetical protein
VFHVAPQRVFVDRVWASVSALFRSGDGLVRRQVDEMLATT